MSEREIELGGTKVRVKEMTVVSTHEPFNIYVLEDGSTLKMKTVVVEVLKALDTYGADGNPVYLVKSSNVVNVDAPDDLKRKGPEEP